MRQFRILLLAMFALSTSFASANDVLEVTDAQYRAGLLTVDWSHTATLDEVTDYTIFGYGYTNGGNVDMYEIQSGSVESFLQTSSQQQHFFSATIRGVQLFPQKVFVVASYENGDSLGSSGWPVDTNQRADLFFRANDEIVPFGQTYRFTPQVAGYSKAELDFELVTAPAGAELTASTGALLWTPAQTDIDESYTFALKVSTKDGSKTFTAEWEIHVAACVQDLTIVVTDKQGDAAKSGRVVIYQWSKNSSNTLKRIDQNVVTINEDARVTFSVLPGEYLVEFQDEYRMYGGVWYMDGSGPEDATEVEVGCDVAVELAIQVEPIQQEEMVTFSGVIEVEGEHGQGQVSLEFIGVDRNLPIDEQLEKAHYFRKDIWLIPNRGTAYSIEVPSKYHYYAKVEGARGPGSLDIQTEFYKEAETLSDAVLLAPIDAAVTIDFTPSLSTFGLGAFQGMVRSEDGKFVNAIVIATRISSLTGSGWSARVRTVTGDSGYYAFEGIPSGEYIVQAIPQRMSGDDMYLPGYYNSEGIGLAVDSWEDATVIVVDGVTVSTNIDIVLSGKTIESKDEDRNVAGTVTKTNGGIKNGSGEVATDNTVEEASIIVRGNDLVVFGTSSADGTYSVGGLEPGLYTMTVDFPGLEPFQSMFEIGMHDLEVTKDVQMKGAITTVEDIAKTTSVRFENGYLFVETLEHVEPLVSVHAIDGSKVAQSQGHTISTRSLTSGTYLVVVEIDGKVEVHAIQFVK